MNTKYARLPLLALLASLLFGTTTAQNVPPPAKTGLLPSTIDVAQRYYPSGFMGDGESGTKFIQIQDACTEKPHTSPTCIKVSYTPGPTGWVGIYWQNKPNNWGEKPGEDFSQKGFKSVMFWARGETGSEVVEFKAGGIDAPGKPFKDSFEETLGKQSITKEWKQYRIPLSGANLSSVIGVFCFTATGTANPKGLTLYMDDICYE